MAALEGEKVLQRAVLGDHLRLSQPGQAWLGSAVLGLARPGSGQLSPAQLGQACPGRGPAQVQSELDSA